MASSASNSSGGSPASRSADASTLSGTSPANGDRSHSDGSWASKDVSGDSSKASSSHESAGSSSKAGIAATAGAAVAAGAMATHSGDTSRSDQADTTTATAPQGALHFGNRESRPDDLTQINGIGKATENDLNGIGVYNFSQIAAFSQQDVDNINEASGFPGRIERDKWIPQARRLGKQNSGSSGSGSGSNNTSSATVTKSSASKQTLRFENRETASDDLQKISGIGPVLEEELNAIGVYNFSQIANFNQNDIDNVNTAFDFPGRIERDEWIPQAKGLMNTRGVERTSSTQGGSKSNPSGTASVSKQTLKFENREASVDDLQKISGVGPVLERELNAIGVYNYSQIANFNQNDIDNVNTAFDFPGRIERDEWIPQARALMNSRSSAVSSGASTDNRSSTAAASKQSLRFENREASVDDLQKISGIGPVLEKELNDIGVYNYSQIASFNQSDIDNVNTAFDFPGRIERDEWIPQAKRLMQDNSHGISATMAAAAVTGVAGAGVAVAASSSDDGSAHSNHPTADQANKQGHTSATQDLKGNDGKFGNEIVERIKLLEMTNADAPRLAVTKEEFDELANGGNANMSRERLINVIKVLRWLCNENT